LFISANTTGLPAELTVWTDADGRDWCVAVVKATYCVAHDGAVSLAPAQAPLVFADEHFGDPGQTSIRYESDFAPYKPRVDVLLHGHVYAPKGQPTTECLAALRVGTQTKTLRVTGRRYWTHRVLGLGPSKPQPFERVELRYENAFGGVDNSHSDAKHQGADLRNPVGCGFRKNPRQSDAMGHPVPQLEYADDPPLVWKKPSRPASLGVVGRGWQPRIGHAGTYDEAWLESRCPFLPEDFDPRYFQAAAGDQQLAELPAGTPVRCAHLTPEGRFAFTIPELRIPIVYRFADRDERPELELDTLLIEPDERRFMLTWRTRVALGRKLTALREVQVGEPRGTVPSGAVRFRNGKPHFRGLGELARWRRGQRDQGRR